MSALGLPVMVAVLLAAQAQPATPDETAQRVAQLVKQLDAPSLDARNAAQQALAEMGPAILELLPASGRVKSAEVKQRLNHLRGQLEERRAREYTQASVISLTGKAIALSDIFTKIEKQTGNRIVDYRQEFGQDAVDRKIDVDFKSVPFWKTVDQIFDLAELTTYGYAEERAVAVVERDARTRPRQGHAAYAGAFRVEAVRLTAQRELRAGDGSTLQVDLEVAWEPRLAPIAIELEMANLRCEDENGRPLAVSADDGTFEAALSPGSATTEFAISLAAPPRSSERIGRLHGELTTLVPGRTESFEFDKLDQVPGDAQTKGGVTVEVLGARRNNEIWQVEIVVSLKEASPALESHRGWIYSNEAVLKSADGKTIENAGFETTLQTGSQVGVNYLFDLDEEIAGHRFVYTTPAAIVTVPITFELRDLPLP